jgi:hypothetical protein
MSEVYAKAHSYGYSEWSSEGHVSLKKPSFTRPYPPPSLDPAENAKFFDWLDDHPNVALPCAWMTND